MRAARIELAGKEAADVVGSEPGNIDSAPWELLLQQASYDTNPMAASSGCQPSNITKMFVEAAQLLGDVVGECRRWPPRARGLMQSGVCHDGLQKWSRHYR
ncbi:MAG: hypothetical protein AMXMBFR31_10360 [Candidatus Desulfobacillus denitrificans]